MPFFKSGKIWSEYWHFDGQQWGIPFTWGYDSINYDSAKVKPITKTTDFLQPALKNKFAIADDMIGMILMSAQALGIANPRGLFTTSEMNQIVAFLTKMKQNARVIASGFGDIVNLYASGEIVANISGFPGMQVLVAQKGIKTVRSALPEEGSLSYCDTYFIPAGGNDTNSVYAFINECLTPPMQAQEAGYLQAGVTTVKGAAAVAPPNRVYVPYNDVQLPVRQGTAVRAPVQPAGWLRFVQRLEHRVGIGQGVLIRGHGGSGRGGWPGPAAAGRCCCCSPSGWRCRWASWFPSRCCSSRAFETSLGTGRSPVTSHSRPT